MYVWVLYIRTHDPARARVSRTMTWGGVGMYARCGHHNNKKWPTLEKTECRIRSINTIIRLRNESRDSQQNPRNPPKPLFLPLPIDPFRDALLHSRNLILPQPWKVQC